MVETSRVLFPSFPVPAVDREVGSQTAFQEGVYPARGKHLLLRMSGCDPVRLNDEKAMLELAHLAATATGATVLQKLSQRFTPQGVTALILLAESHASLHTYPEAGVIFWDCFTCGDTCDPARSIAVLEEALSPTDVSSQVIKRD